MPAISYSNVVPDTQAAEFATLVSNLKQNAVWHGDQARTYDKLADLAAGYNPRLATLLRDHADSFRNLSIMGKTL